MNRKNYENEEEIKNLKENIKILESINEKSNKELTETKKINLNLNHTIDNLKLKYDNEIEIYKNKINEYENKLNEIYSNNNYEE